VVDVAPLQKRLEEAEENNKAADRAEQAGQLAEEYDSLQGTSADLDSKIVELDTEKIEAIKNSKLPVDGLSFDDDGVLYQDVPFQQASNAERIRVSVAMAMALNPDIRVIRITDGSLLDSDNFKLIEDMASFLRSTISKRLTLEYDLAAALPPIRADQTQLRQIIMNIVTNASEASGEGDGVITIRTSEWNPTTQNFQSWYVLGDLPASRSVVLTIQDTGCGMASEMIPKIFDPFYSTKFPGRGLGLAALLGLAQAHAAAIAVRSQPDVGTEFSLLFPATTTSPSTKRAPVFSIPTQHSSLTKKPTVLVVDDEEDVRVACSMIFEEMGLKTLVASDGQIGIQVFQQHQHDIMVVLLDLTMPNMDGQQFFEYLQGLNATIPVILSSGYSEEEAMKRFHNPDMAAFIQKPYQVETLIAKVEEIRQKQTASSKNPGL